MEDLIKKQWNGVTGHKHMAMEDRAKIFLPFAALKGHEEAILERQKITVEKSDLSEEMKENLDKQFQILAASIQNKEHPMIKIVYFKKDKDEDGGVYLEKTGMVSRLDFDSRYIQVVNEKIDFEEIYAIDGDLFENMF